MIDFAVLCKSYFASFSNCVQLRKSIPFLTRLVTSAVAQQRPQHGLDVEGISAVEAHDHPEVRGAGVRGQRGSDAEVTRGSVLDALHQGPETVLDHGPLLDLVPVLVQEGTLQTLSQVLSLLPQAETVLL